MKLNQLLAVEKGEKNRTLKAITELHRKSQKENLYEGRIRDYKPLDEDGEKLPPEKQLVQVNAKQVLEEQADILLRLWNLTYAKDCANTIAKADVKVGTTTIMKDVPVTHLLFLEKQLNDVETFISKIPTLDPSEQWKFSSEQNCYVTEKAWSNRTKKLMRNHVQAEATDHHPAQVKTYTEDEVIGHYVSIRHSGALPVSRKEALLARVHALKNSVVEAREKANLQEVTVDKSSESFFDFLLQN